MDQFFRVEEGTARVTLNGTERHLVRAGSAFIVPAGTRHNVGEDVVRVLAQRRGDSLRAGRDQALVVIQGNPGGCPAQNRPYEGISWFLIQ